MQFTKNMKLSSHTAPSPSAQRMRRKLVRYARLFYSFLSSAFVLLSLSNQYRLMTAIVQQESLAKIATAPDISVHGSTKEVVPHVKSERKPKIEVPIDSRRNLRTEGSMNPSVLIGVLSSRANFTTRVKSIVDTWGQPQNIPQGTMLRYFVGAPPSDSKFLNRTVEEDIEDLAEMAGIEDTSMIVVMNHVIDEEYPPVRKNTAMIEHLDQLVEGLEKNTSAPSTFEWIFKAEDDTYVNFGAMLNFLRARRSEGYQLYGEQEKGVGEEVGILKAHGLVKPYCTHGAGYIMSRKLVKDTAPYFQSCVREFDKSSHREYVWSPDKAVGMCFYKYAGVGCWDSNDYFLNRIFLDNKEKRSVFPLPSMLERTITSHPFKDPISMMKQHLRHVEAAPKRKSEAQIKKES